MWFLGDAEVVTDYFLPYCDVNW